MFSNCMEIGNYRDVGLMFVVVIVVNSDMEISVQVFSLLQSKGY